MKRRYVTSVLSIVIASSFATPASAGGIVFDPINFIVNAASLIELKLIQHSLVSQSNGTVNYYTKNMYDYDIRNYEINADFTWIINKGGDEIIPIPKDVGQKINELVGGSDKKSFEAYAARYRDAAYYSKSENAKETGVAALEGSRARKAANDMMVASLHEEQQSLGIEAKELEGFAKQSAKAEGQGHQLQIANALAGSQVTQMMRLRNAIMVSDAHRVAESQAAADTEARAIAVGTRMRNGLDKKVSGAMPLMATRR